MVQLTRTGVVADQATVDRLRAEFRRQDWVRLPQILNPALLTFTLDHLDAGGWNEVSEDFYSEAQPIDGPAVHLLMFLANLPGFLDVAHAITGCGPFTWFDGRVYRMSPGGGHHDHWHSDWSDGRRVALSLNVSRQPYRGGDLRIRAVDRPGTVVTVPNPEPGDAIVFRLGPDLVHKVAEVDGPAPKTAFAGWFNATELPLLNRLHALALRRT